MFPMKRSAAVACSAFLAASSLAYADARSSPKDAAYECARVMRDQAGPSAYEVVRMSELPGRASYRIWMNAHDESVGAYCTTRRGKVTESFTRNSVWSGRYPAQPEELQVAANCTPGAGR